MHPPAYTQRPEPSKKNGSCAKGILKLSTVRKPAHAQKCIKVFSVIDIVRLLHVSATVVAILREERYKGWIYRDITEVYESMHGSTIHMCIGLYTCIIHILYSYNKANEVH